MDGVPLHAPENGRYVMEGTVLPAPPALNLSKVTTATRHGVMPVGWGTHAASSVSVAFMVVGDTRAELEERWQALRVLVGRPSMVMEHVVSSGESRTAEVRCEAISEPVYLPQEWAIECTVTFGVPGGVWQDAELSTGAPGAMGAFEGTVLPITNVEIHGEATTGELVIEDVATGTRVSWVGEPGAVVTIWPATFKAVDDDGNDVSSGLFVGARPFQLAPDATGKVDVDATGGLVDAITGRRCY